ncbi:MAG: hypothetical protein JO053_06835 [Acidobacteria bacterium]|nr:hypothetical protein [Acidobacteriota bacterium]
MNKRITNIVAFLAVAAGFLISSTTVAEAQKRNERDIRDAVRSLSSRLDDFEYDLRYQMQSSSQATTNVSDASDRIRAMRDEISRFQENLDQKRENRDDVNAIIGAANGIENFLAANPQNRRVTDDWELVHTQLQRLASNYSVAVGPQSTVGHTQNDPSYSNGQNYPQSNQPGYSPGMAGNITVGLSGTYDLDASRSEKIEDIVASAGLGDEQRADLHEKLEAPQQIAIDIRGDQVTLASSNASPVTFTADGRDKIDKDAQGRTVRLRAALNGQTLTIAKVGGDTDYTITFTQIGTSGLKVTRRITTDYLDQTVFAESVYNKTDSIARLGIPIPSSSAGQTNSGSPDTNGGYSDNDQNRTTSNGGTGNMGTPPATVSMSTGRFIIPNGTVLTGSLQNEVNTEVSQNNDRFRLTVQSPNEYRGAVIEGYLSGVGRSGKVTGKANVTFNFERITLRDGQAYDFKGTIQGIKDSTGKIIQVDNEGTVTGSSQGNETAKRGGIGAGIGALIGAIAGGGSGAAVGAIIGGSVGAGTMVMNGKGDIRLLPGSTITIQASGPTNPNYPR